MNLSLFRSWHAGVAAVVIAVFLVWSLRSGTPLGWQVGTDRTFLLWSGWVALVLYLVLWAYAARKAAHRTRWSPEFARAVPLAQLEAAQEQLSDLRVDAFAGRITEPAELSRRAREVVASAGVGGVITVAGAPATNGGAPVLRVRWREPLVRLARWMHAHVYYGLAAAFLVTLHGGMRFTSPMSIALNTLSLLVLGTGFFGIVLWTFGPRWLSAAERDLAYERAAALRAHYARKVAGQAAALRAAAPAAVDGALRDARARPGLLAALAPEQQAAGRDLLTLLGQRDAVAATWQRLARRRFVLNGWRIVHVPLSLALVLAVAVHVFSVWIY